MRRTTKVFAAAEVFATSAMGATMPMPCPPPPPLAIAV